ncbi:hypothetical protein CDAR_609801 [Caerostris darwini]|uniref:Uncharacterized protein n=1 Tax=Caerostris darwini TaxID=1538125 RepID=A0AAV4VN80_9ARAC|nr:hypothetical protein CDAR_609801 [Caerostris darwini]
MGSSVGVEELLIEKKGCATLSGIQAKMTQITARQRNTSCPSRLIPRLRNERAESSLDAGMMGRYSLIERKVSINAKRCMRNDKGGAMTGHVN